ncbi:hypothetical protein [Lysobacter fragariae]
MHPRVSRPCLAALLLAIAFSTGCSRDPRDNDFVHYSGTSLEVEGVDYPRAAKPEFQPARGRVLVTPKEDQRAAAIAVLQRYGLPLAGTTKGGILVATVPEGFEFQWMDALSRNAPILTTATDDPVTPFAIEPEAAAVPASTGVPVPDDEPPADVVRRLTYEMYEKLEAAGGVAIQSTATGNTAVVHMQLADVQKESCKRLPGSKPGEYECGVLLKVRSCLNLCDPSGEEALNDAKRIDIRWDPSGKWVLG